MLDLQDRLDELKELGLYRRMRMVSGPQGPRVVLDGKPVLLLCSNNYLGLADHPRVREAAADAAMRWGVGAGRVAARVGQHDAAPAAGGAARGVQGHAERGAVRLGLPGQPRRHAGARAARRGRVLRRAQPRVDHRRLPARRRGDVRLPPRRRRPPRVGPAQRRRARRADRHRRRVLDGRRRRAARGDRRARAPPRRARDGRRRARHRHARARAGAARSPRPGSRARST